MTFASLTRPQGRLLSRVSIFVYTGTLLAACQMATAQSTSGETLSPHGEVSYSDKHPLSLPDAPSTLTVPASAAQPTAPTEEASSSSATSFPLGINVDWVDGVQNHTNQNPSTQTPADQTGKPRDYVDVDANGKPIPIDRHQTHRIGGIIPNYRAVSGGAVAHPPGWKYNFKVATHQAFDYAGFIFLGITSLSAEGLNEHPVFGKGVDGFWKYTWHGFIDKTDGTYIQAWFLPSLLHEDTRYYAMGNQHRVVTRFLYVVSRQAVARTYSGHDTPNIAGLGGKVLTQYISRSYYPANSADFATLATKFSYGVARDIGFTALREFYPDYLGYKARKKQRKAAAQSALDKAAVSASGQSQGTPAATKP